MKPSTRRLLRRCKNIVTGMAAICALTFVIGYMQQKDDAAQRKAEAQMASRIFNKFPVTELMVPVQRKQD